MAVEAFERGGIRVDDGECLLSLSVGRKGVCRLHVALAAGFGVAVLSVAGDDFVGAVELVGGVGHVGVLCADGNGDDEQEEKKSLKVEI